MDPEQTSLDHFELSLNISLTANETAWQSQAGDTAMGLLLCLAPCSPCAGGGESQKQVVAKSSREELALHPRSRPK